MDRVSWGCHLKISAVTQNQVGKVKKFTLLCEETIDRLHEEYYGLVHVFVLTVIAMLEQCLKVFLKVLLKILHSKLFVITIIFQLFVYHFRS